MRRESKYLVVKKETCHGFVVKSCHDTENAAKSACSIDECVVSLEIISQDVEYSLDAYGGECSIVTVNALIDNVLHNASYYVQLACGEYLSQMGCWITTTSGDHEFSDVETMIYNVADVVELAEEAAKEHKLNNYEYIDANFNCSINSQSLKIKIDKNDGTATLVLINDDHNSHDYSVAEKQREKFETQEDALEYLEQFRTDEYHDFRGLYAYINTDVK